MLTWLATSSSAEPGLAFYSIAAVWHAARYMRARDTPSLVGAGLFAGAAAGTKYLGLVSAALVLVPLALVVAPEPAEDVRWPARSRLRDWSRCRGTCGT